MFEAILIAQNFALSPAIASKVIACEKHLSINVENAESLKYQKCLEKLDLNLEPVKACRRKHLTDGGYNVFSQAPLGVRKQYKACLTGITN